MGSQHDANPDLSSASHDRVEQHAVETDGREQEPDGRKEPGEDSQQPLPEYGIVDKRRLLRELCRAKGRMRVMNRRLDGRAERKWITRGSNRHRAQAAQSHVHRRGRDGARVVIADVADDSDDLLRYGRTLAGAIVCPAESGAAPKIAPHEGLVDNDADRLDGVGIPSLEIAAVEQTNA